uniref:Uncharacterized protein n=1 Tax=Alexandrium monilatum TaxID=311494 RepID=A0A7S4R4P6_9DINO
MEPALLVDPECSALEAVEPGDLGFADGLEMVVLRGVVPSRDAWTVALEFLFEELTLTPRTAEEVAQERAAQSAHAQQPAHPQQQPHPLEWQQSVPHLQPTVPQLQPPPPLQQQQQQQQLQQRQTPPPSKPPPVPSASWGSSRSEVWVPFRRLCCTNNVEAGEADDVIDGPPVSNHVQFGEEEMVSTTSLSTLTSALGTSQELQERRGVTIEGGDHYRGQWCGQHRHGRGTLVRQSGHSYEGTFECSRAHGHGKWRTPDGTTYEGQWERDLKHGFGKYLHPDGTTYEGEWQLDLKSGRGCEHWSDGARYAGEFVKGRKHGVGIYTGRDAKKREWRYEGQWAADMMDGEGCYTYSDGRHYCGQWEAGCMAGVGRMDYPDGSHYEGSYEQGLKHGEGTYITAAGVVHRGQWFRGKMGGAPKVAGKAAAKSGHGHVAFGARGGA